MKIIVKIFSGKILTFEEESLCKVELLKMKIQMEESIDISNQILIYFGHILEDGRILAFYGITNECILYLQNQPNSFPIFVKNISSGKIINLYLEYTDTIRTVKAMIKNLENINFRTQNLYFNGIILDDSKNLSYYNIFKHSTIMMMLESEEDFPIYIKTMKENYIRLNVSGNTKIKTLKEKIMELGKMNLDFQIIFEGNVLENKIELNSYNIKENSKLYLIWQYENFISINIKIEKNQEIVSIEAKRTNTINVLKQSIYKIKKISTRKQNLFFEGFELDNTKTLEDYNIVNGDFIELDNRIKKINILIRDISEKTFCITVNKNCKITSIKKKILMKRGLPINQQKLYFQGKFLSDNEPLFQYKIQNGGILNLVHNYMTGGIQILVTNILNKKVYTIDMGSDERIQILKERFVEKIKDELKINKIIIFYAGKILENERTLADYNIQKTETTVFIICKPKGKIYVISKDFSPLAVYVKLNYTIKMVKKLLEVYVNYQMQNLIDKSELVFNENPLEDDKTLEYYNICKENTLFLIEKRPFNQVLIQTYIQGHIIPIPFENNDSVYSLQKKIESIEGTKIEQQLLFYKGVKMKEDNPLSDYNISNSSLLYLIKKSSKIKIFIKTENGNILTIFSDSNDTIYSIKVRINGIEKIIPEKQRITFEGNKLDDNKTLVDYNIMNESILDCFFDLESIIIFITRLNNQNKISLGVKIEDKIESIYERIQKELNHSINLYKLFFNDQELLKDKTFQNYFITNRSTILMTPINKINKIFVKDIAGKKHQLDVCVLDTIIHAKIKIQELTDLNIEEQILIFSGKELKNNLCFVDYNIHDEAIIDIIRKPKREIKIFIETPQEMLSLEVDFTDSIESLKERIKVLKEIRPIDQILSFKGKELLDRQFLSDYNIKNESLVEFLVKSFTIIVRMESNKNVSLNIKYFYSFEYIKSLLEILSGIPKEKQVLIFEDRIIDNKKTIEFYNINSKALFFLFEEKHENIQIFIVLSKRNILNFSAEKEDSILKLKQKN